MALHIKELKVIIYALNLVLLVPTAEVMNQIGDGQIQKRFWVLEI